ncbi:MAG TPA: hypothetical protein VMA96_06350 [Solirubrobacteraceae bacterium]|nr:hypothetical protein [Solirubrobacteraceae bacterium]
MAPHKHQLLLTEAIEREGEAQRQLLEGRADVAHAEFAAASELYRQSWEAAHARAFGRLVGMLKASVLAGGGTDAAGYARTALADADPDSATANYARALAALIAGDDEDARALAARLQEAPEAFARTGRAIAALASRDAAAYATALEAIVRDFEQRSEHLTGVAIADTALMLQALAGRRRMAVAIDGPVLPARGTVS